MRKAHESRQETRIGSTHRNNGAIISTVTVHAAPQLAAFVLNEASNISQRLVGREELVELLVGGVVHRHGFTKETVLQSKRVCLELLGQMIENKRIQEALKRILTSKYHKDGRTRSTEILSLLIVSLRERFVLVCIMVVHQLIVVKVLFYAAVPVVVGGSHGSAHGFSLETADARLMDSGDHKEHDKNGHCEGSRHFPRQSSVGLFVLYNSHTSWSGRFSVDRDGPVATSGARWRFRGHCDTTLVVVGVVSGCFARSNCNTV